MRIVVINHVSLDGVMQAPGRADEDTRDGFEHGGWASAPDPEVGQSMGARMADSDGLLLGRRTYEDLLASWNAQGGPFKDALNKAQKYVASATLTEPLPWPNSTLLAADVVSEVRALQARPGRELQILGSGQLIHTLMAHHLVDELMLIIHPIVLGRGRRLFADDGTNTTLELLVAKPTARGAIVATYRAIGQPS
ncbi:MAG TPA: dihydrofolate reductase family protein [Acidimicrobiales bacterium]|nr:dihydrofolate reductase family protein [Acidimicrobiales bacterium]